MKKLLNVANRLPITIGKSIKKSSGGLVSALEGIVDEYDFSWIGWTGDIVTDAGKKQEIATQLIEQYNCSPVFLSKKEVNYFYNCYSNSSLWPLLHYMPTNFRYDDRWFGSYKNVNHYFADAVLGQARKNDLVWIHDYHLMLLPSILREKRPELTVGFFLHTPFPSFELFRCHPDREELLVGILGADLVGFHTFSYLRHFRSTVLRVLGIESEMHCINHENHSTNIGVYPIGIDSEKFTSELKTKQFGKYLDEYRQVYRDKQVVLGVERLDYTKGISRRLDAIERFLSKYRRRDNIVFILVSVPSRGDVQEYQDLLEEIGVKVSQINGKYSTIKNVPVHFLNKSVNFSELCALYSLADVAIVTPLIDGMNLVAKEYLACQQEKSGVLILSEFAGSAQELFNALIVNPYDINQVAESIREALALSGAEKKELIEPMKERVLNHNAKYWAESFIKDLSTKSNDNILNVATKEIAAATVKPFIKAEKIALFLDYDGTLCELKNKPSDAYPNEEIKEVFALLESINDIDVYIISGRKREDMEQWFSPYNFTLIAEHGYYYITPELSDWAVFDERSDLSWKANIIDVFKHFTGMTPGSFVEEKTASVVWHYRRSDPEFGTWKANQLVGELYEMLSNLPVEIRHGKKIVEVSSSQINKGLVVEHFMGQNKYDAVLCAGDDETDESMFRLDCKEIVSIKVGSGETHAKFNVALPKILRKYLKLALLHRANTENS